MNKFSKHPNKSDLLSANGAESACKFVVKQIVNPYKEFSRKLNSDIISKYHIVKAGNINNCTVDNAYDNVYDFYIRDVAVYRNYSKNNTIKKIFDIKHICQFNNTINIIPFDQVVDLFLTDSDAKSYATFLKYLFGIGLYSANIKLLYSWSDIKKIIYYYYNTNMKDILTRLYIYIDAYYTDLANDIAKQEKNMILNNIIEVDKYNEKDLEELDAAFLDIGFSNMKLN